MSLRLLAFCLVAALALAERAAAHAQLAAAEPAAGAVLPAMPERLELTFTEPVGALAFRWFPPGGEAISVEPMVSGASVLVPVPTGLGEGTHLLSWRVASADGHPVGGSHVFSVGAPSGAPRAAAEGSAGAAALGRGLLTLALVFGVGGAVFATCCDRGFGPAGFARRLAFAAALAAPPLAALALAAHGRDLVGGGAPWSDAVAAALGASFAASAGLAGAAGVAAMVALRRERAWLATLALGLAALSFAVSGHAANARPAWLTAPAIALHAAGFVFWIGALPGLAARARSGGEEVARLLRRFSAWATPLVAVLVATGMVLAFVQVARPAALVETGYGRLLAAKLALVLVLLALAALNRWRLTPALAAGDPRALPRLRRSVAAEIVLGFAILVLASGFRLTPPPRALADPPGEIAVAMHGAATMATVAVRPARAGANAVEIVLSGHGGEAPEPLAVAVAFAKPDENVEPITAEAAREDGSWRAGPIQLPLPGRWSLRLDVLVSDFEQETLRGEIELSE